VLDALLRALGPAGGDPARAGRARAYREALRGRRVLLTLDNAADAEQVRPLLADAPGCLTLVTSRRAIAVPGATRIELAGLPPADSLALLRSAAGADRLAAAPAAAGEIAELCGHLPLALGLAAGHLRAHPDWPLADHAERLRLVGPAGVVPALTLSYERLDPAERETFRLLGEHPGPHLTAAAAAALTGTDPDTARARLAVLAAANLLSERAQGRYELHDLVRAYAAGRAVEEDPASVRRQAFRRLYEFSVGAAADAVDSLYGRRPGSGPPAEAQGWLDAERPVLLSLAGRAEAAGWPDRSAELTVGLAAVLRTYLEIGSWNADARRLHRHALHAARSRGDRAAQGDALHNLALAESRLGAVAAAVGGFGRALAVRRELGDRIGEVRTLGQLASTESRRGRYHQAQRHLREAVAAADPADPVVLSYLLSNQAAALIKLGQDAAAAAVLARAIGLAETAADRYGLAWMENNLGVAGRQLGRLEEAVERHERALALHREVGDRAGEAFAESNLGIDRRLLGRLPEALAHAGRSMALAEEVGDPGMSAQLGNDTAETLYAAGRATEALAAHRAALSAARRGADRHEQARAHHGIAVVLAGSGRSGRAAPHEARSRAIYEDLGVPMGSA
jgi:tetratricopeptide (TPR) repeat protein